MQQQLAPFHLAVLIIIDGLPRDLLSKTTGPFLYEACANKNHHLGETENMNISNINSTNSTTASVVCGIGHTEWFPDSSTNHASILTGSSASMHGIWGNIYIKYGVSSKKPVLGGGPLCQRQECAYYPNVMDVIRASNGTAAAFYKWDGPTSFMDTGFSNLSVLPSDEEVFEKTMRQIDVAAEVSKVAPASPGIVVAQFLQVDDSGHNHGRLHGDNLHHAIAMVDQYTKRIVSRTIKLNGVVMAVSDHGRDAANGHYDHEDAAPYARTTDEREGSGRAFEYQVATWIPSSKPTTYWLKRGFGSKDISPTLMHCLGLDNNRIPIEWDGRALTEVCDPTRRATLQPWPVKMRKQPCAIEMEAPGKWIMSAGSAVLFIGVLSCIGNIEWDHTLVRLALLMAAAGVCVVSLVQWPRPILAIRYWSQGYFTVCFVLVTRSVVKDNIASSEKGVSICSVRLFLLLWIMKVVTFVCIADQVLQGGLDVPGGTRDRIDASISHSLWLGAIVTIISIQFLELHHSAAFSVDLVRFGLMLSSANSTSLTMRVPARDPVMIVQWVLLAIVWCYHAYIYRRKGITAHSHIIFEEQEQVLPSSLSAFMWSAWSIMAVLGMLACFGGQIPISHAKYYSYSQGTTWLAASFVWIMAIMSMVVIMAHVFPGIATTTTTTTTTNTWGGRKRQTRPALRL